MTSARELHVGTPQGRVYVEETPGDDPAIVMMHGFPDDHRGYDKLVPLLSPKRVVVFDWLGYGRSGSVAAGIRSATGLGPSGPSCCHGSRVAILLRESRKQALDPALACLDD